jgi:hypothetical protein
MAGATNAEMTGNIPRTKEEQKVNDGQNVASGSSLVEPPTYDFL